MRDRKTRTVCNGDLLASCIRLMQCKIAEIGSQVMRRTTIENPIIRIVGSCGNEISTWLPGSRSWRVRARVHIVGSSVAVWLLELGAASRAMTVNSANLTTPLVSSVLLIIVRTEVLLLPSRLLLPVGVVSVLTLVLVAVPMIVIGTSIVRRIRSDRKRSWCWRLCKELHFMIQQFLVYFRNHRCGIATF